MQHDVLEKIQTSSFARSIALSSSFPRSTSDSVARRDRDRLPNPEKKKTCLPVQYSFPTFPKKVYSVFLAFVIMLLVFSSLFRLVLIMQDENEDTITGLAAKRYRMIFSNVDSFYLDCGYGAWIGVGNNWCSPYKGT